MECNPLSLLGQLAAAVYVPGSAASTLYFASEPLLFDNVRLSERQRVKFSLKYALLEASKYSRGWPGRLLILV